MAVTTPAPRLRIPWPLQDALQHVDDRLVSRGYRALSVSTRRVRSQLRAAGRAFVDPDQPDPPDLAALDRTASWLISQSSARATALGGVAGLAGALTLPHEVAATVLASVRLAQRLAVVYGFDPETDRGKMAMWRALAAGFEVDLPDRGPVGTRVRDLAGALAPGLATPRTVGSALASRVLRRAAGMVAGRGSRWLPLFSAGPGALGGRERVTEVGARMQGILRQLAEVPVGAIPVVEEAVEVKEG